MVRGRPMLGRPVLGKLVPAIGAAGLAAVLSACAPAPAAQPDAPQARVAGMAFSFEDVLEPRIYSHAGPAVAEAEDAAPGLWAAVPGLARAERGRIVNPASGAKVDVALYRGRGATIRLSPEAAKALGVAGRAVPVQVTALRREPKVSAPATQPRSGRGR